MPERVAYLEAVDEEEGWIELTFGPESVEEYLDTAERRTADAFSAWFDASREMPEWRAYRRAQKRVADDEAARFDAWQLASASMPEFIEWHKSWQDRAKKILAEQAWERASADVPEYQAFRRATRALARADRAVAKADALADQADHHERQAMLRDNEATSACEAARIAWEVASYDLPEYQRWRDGAAIDLSVRI